MAKLVNPAELELLAETLDTLQQGYADLPPFETDFDTDAAAAVLAEVATKMQDNYPYFHPQYAGQMLKPPHPVARIAYAMALWINPNNHALDGGRASSALEKECIVDLGRLYGWEQPLGHLTSGGTMANLEALWVAGTLQPGKRIVASEQAHYTHSRISSVLKLPFTSIPVDQAGRMDCSALERELEAGDVGTVVATIGTTGLGAVDPLPALLELRERHGFRIHADAAYGGYFGLCESLAPATRSSFDRLAEVDSIVVDPHKHGLQPYGCGCVLFRDASVGKIYLHDSPYTYFSSEELHLGEISLECSRAGAAATALWATMRLLPLERGGEFSTLLEQCLSAARRFHAKLKASPAFVPLYEPELDIVVYAVSAADTATSARQARRLFERAAAKELHLALIELPTRALGDRLGPIEINSETVTCLRSVLMKPEQEDWIDRIVALLEEAAAEL
ncbi:MAG: aminotransferase class V-fold PLP-dependent enzyme [Woeseiaceae bacterium]|jgi:glutamate/tyrosine decarboxylase-like PLP-dependent enzyme|nr:aminotransferase class V-fold PLP-dependent enzyme [Woeseiaceae bacterium]